MKFILKAQKPTEPTFYDIQIDQFFVSKYGYLCQKISSTKYTTIAGPSGVPYSRTCYDAGQKMQIKKALPLVEKIEF